jgi:hypothetical protein
MDDKNKIYKNLSEINKRNNELIKELNLINLQLVNNELKIFELEQIFNNNVKPLITNYLSKFR